MIQIWAPNPTAHVFHSKQQMLIITPCSLKLSNIPVTVFCSYFSEPALLTVSGQHKFFSSVTLESVWWAPPTKEKHLGRLWLWPSLYIPNGMGYLVLYRMVRMNHEITDNVDTIYPASLCCITLSRSFNLYICVCPYIPVYVHWFCIHNYIYFSHVDRLDVSSCILQIFSKVKNYR